MIAITPSGPLTGRVQVPGSKYQANRALILAALAQGSTDVSPVPSNDDIDRVIAGLRALGLNVTEQNSHVTVQSDGYPQTWPSAQLNAGASGTFARFALALSSLALQPMVVDGTVRLRERPMSDLAAALRELGVSVAGQNDALPLTITGPLRGGVCHLPGHISSQFISALLMAAPLAARDVEIQLSSPLVSKNYVDMTIAMMANRGVTVETLSAGFKVRAGQKYNAGDIILEADPCSASYFMAAAAITAGDIEIAGFNIDSVQGEAQLPHVLDQMGCLIKRTANGLRVMGPGLGLRCVDVDMGNMPDVVQTVAVLAAFAKGVTRMHNIGHLVHKESNRIFDTALELKKLGVQVEASADALIIHGAGPTGDKLQGAVIETHEDHRMAMSFAIAGLKLANVRIADHLVVNKSFPQYWDTLRSLGVSAVEQGSNHGR